MSQENDSGRVNGFVIGSNKGGREWMVRVKEPKHQLNGCKLPVSTIHVGTELRPGLDVSFLMPVYGKITVAADVMATPRAEDNSKTSKQIAKDVASIGIMLVKHNGRYSLTFTGARSVQEAQKDLDDLGAENETVISVIVMLAG